MTRVESRDVNQNPKQVSLRLSLHEVNNNKQGLDLIEPAADMGFGDMERRPRGPQAHGILHRGVV